MTLFAHHQLLLAIPFAGPVVMIIGVLTFISVRDRLGSRRRNR